MARPKKFDKDTAFQQALNLFWKDGYEKTSLDDLLAAMNIQRSSFYNTFGNKRQVFLDALQQYIQDVNHNFTIATLEASANGRSGIEQVFYDLIGFLEADDDQKGCLIVNTQVEIAPHDADVACMIEESNEQVVEAFIQAIQRGQAAKVIRETLNPEDAARFLVNMMTGMRVRGRYTQERAEFESIARVALLVLD